MKEGKNCSLLVRCQICITRYSDNRTAVPAVRLKAARERSATSVTLLAVKARLGVNVLNFSGAPSFSEHVVALHQRASFVTCPVGSLLFMNRSITCILKRVGT